MAVKETLSYSDGVKGWPSFYSFLPDYLIGMNSFFYSFHQGQLYRHNTNELRNNYYGVQYNSNITGVFNVQPQTIKLFKTMSLESDAAWGVKTLETDLGNGDMLSTYFEQKEGEWFSFIRNKSTTVNFKLRSANGIGQIAAVNVAFVGIDIVFNVSLGSIISIGDTLYHQVTPTSSRPTGIITAINQATNTVTIAVVLNMPLASQFAFYYKDPVAESHGARGYFMRFQLENTDTTPVELFSVGSSVMKSYP
jgi:hypothetical protein